MLYVQNAYIDRTQNAFLGESDVYETHFDDNERGDLFRASQREYGRCVGTAYVDRDEEAQRIGWVFVKREAFEDSPSETYLREVWVTVHEQPETRTREYHYA